MFKKTISIYTLNQELYNNYTDYLKNKSSIISKSSGFDLIVPNDIVVYDSNILKIDFEISICITDNDDNNYASLLYPRSSLSLSPLRLANSVGVIDMDYIGNIKGIFDIIPNTKFPFTIQKGTRLVQICLSNLDVFNVKMIFGKQEETTRNCNGFGSTGNILNFV